MRTPLRPLPILLLFLLSNSTYLWGQLTPGPVAAHAQSWVLDKAGLGQPKATDRGLSFAGQRLPPQKNDPDGQRNFSMTGTPESEVTAVVSHRDSNRLVACAISSPEGLLESIGLPIYYSDDGVGRYLESIELPP